MVELIGSADKNLIATWDKKLNACQQERVNFEHQWHLNMSFFFGKQWVITTKNPTTGGYSLVEQRPKDQHTSRHTANRILRIVRTELTKLTKDQGQFYCLPDSTEEGDRLAAMAGDSISEYIMTTKYFNRKKMMAVFWACVTGTGFLKNFYDPNKKDLDGEPGRIDFEAVTPFHIFVPNLQATELEDQPYLFHARTMNPEDVWNSYGQELEPGTSSSSLVVDSRFLTSVGIRSQANKETKQCYVKEVYVKPCKEFPEGAMFTYGEGKILYVHEAPEPMQMMMPGMEDMAPGQLELDLEYPLPPVGQNTPVGDEIPAGFPTKVNDQSGETEKQNVPKSIHEGGTDYRYSYPYRHGYFPFVKIDHIPTGIFYSESVIKSLIGPQKEYNKTRSLMLDTRNLAGKPQYWYTKGAFDPKLFTTIPGLNLPVNMGFEPPKPIEQAPPYPGAAAELDTTLRDIDDISAQFEVAKGRTPPGVEAASAIAYLSEENDTILFHTVESLEDAVQMTGVQVLANVHDFWPAERIVRMTSKNQTMEVMEFKASDLNPLTDFRVEPGSMAPRSLAARQAFITELMKLGAIEPLQGLRYLQMSETNKLYDELMVDVRHAQRENVYMSKGQPLYKVDAQATEQRQMMLQSQQMATPVPGMPMEGMMPGMDSMSGGTGIESLLGGMIPGMNGEAGNSMPPVTPPMGGMGPLMGPIYKQAARTDPMTGKELTDPTTGQPVMYQVTINAFDAHEIHIEEHQKYQKSQEYELLEPSIQQIIQDHVDEHKMEMLKERNAVQADTAAKGAPIPEGETPPPREEAGSSYRQPDQVDQPVGANV